ncbi:ComF family protein [Geomesophilobacter sediminis]|nr:ComF family protein [Geomesophilobacter sediminis]
MIRALLDLLFPPLCHACKGFIPDRRSINICDACLADVSFVVSPYCPVCGIPYPMDGGLDHLCGACSNDPPFDACRSAALLDGPVQELIHRFKYSGQVHLAVPLGRLVAECLKSFYVQAQPEVILPVPLHRKRLRQRGYNQSQMLGKVIGKVWGIPVLPTNLRRVRWTDPQTGMSAGERRTNVAGAFEVRNPAQLKGKRVLLVDDVLTTGSTVRACAAALYSAEVEAVFVATVARGIPP